ncbi:signal peptidase I [Nocardioides alcanivorans]|uniref:signal peptidase I n=1 Tax=Nocardioides alcanivorans TaxID=2897352 RepID=UPI001F3B35D2|nr:signal peptidase I [Nocardioides alcanivorans]
MRRRLVLALTMTVAGLPLAAAASGWRVVEVTSDSMAPALRTGDHVVAAPLRGEPSVGDIVVFTPPHHWRAVFPRWSSGDRVPERMVKRVVAEAGDRVECCAADGSLLVNGERIDEPYLASAPGSGNTPTYRVVVPDGQVWLLGDNRDVSFDSSVVGALTGAGSVPTESLTGRVVGRG